MPVDPVRHLLATIAYRFDAVVAGCAPNFVDFVPAAEGVRGPRALLAHCVDVLRLARASYEPGLGASASTMADAGWQELVARVHAELAALDQHLEHRHRAHTWSVEQMVQGPFADVLTHIGQLAMLRRMAGDPMPAQSYLRAPVRTGRVGPDQGPSVVPGGNG